MEKMLGMCGLICSDCPAFLATQKDDDVERKKVAKLRSTDSQVLEVQDINCDGCTKSGGRLFKFSNNCEVRRCGITKNINNCADCAEYPCKKLELPHKQSPDAKANLEEIRRKP